jgi:hypothetical protein
MICKLYCPQVEGRHAEGGGAGRRGRGGVLRPRGGTGDHHKNVVGVNGQFGEI